MSVRIQLESRHNTYTNLDFVTGRVTFSTLSQETISAITVKLEGESRTRLAGVLNPRRTYDGFQKEQAQLEIHKLLYEVQTVFPTDPIPQQSSKNQYTLPPGQYEYRFQFKIPLNNNCVRNSSLLNNLNMASMRMEMAQGVNAHVKQTLPPSLSGLPGEAEIRYYVKATVQRPAFYKENFRAHSSFMFFPIEPIRGPLNKRESFARRTHQFVPSINVPGKAGVFRKPSFPTTESTIAPPNVSVDGRLPDPAIITCNEPLPLRILVSKLNDSPATLFLQLLHIELVGYTNIRAHELRRQEVGSWMIMSSANMRMPLNDVIASEKESNVWDIDPKAWNQYPLPNTVSPTFVTCNLSRKYELHIKVGLAWGSGNNINPELSMQPIRMPVKVYSGIAPPPGLVAAVAGQTRPPQSAARPNIRPPGRMGSSASSQSRPQAQPQPPSDHIEPSPSDIPDIAPPSYEDAMAADLGPVDGPRRDYQQQPSGQAPAYGDVKTPVNDDRLFPDSGR